jgi:hypothetical protein
VKAEAREKATEARVHAAERERSLGQRHGDVIHPLQLEPAAIHDLLIHDLRAKQDLAGVQTGGVQIRAGVPKPNEARLERCDEAPWNDQGFSNPVRQRLPRGAARSNDKVGYAGAGSRVGDGAGGEVQQSANGSTVAIHNRLVEKIFVKTDVMPAGHAEGHPSRWIGPGNGARDRQFYMRVSPVGLGRPVAARGDPL